MIFGIRPVIEALKSGKEIEKLLIQTNIKSAAAFELKDLLKELEIPFQYVPVEKLNKLTYKNHQGVIGFLSLIAYQPIEQVLPLVYESGKVPLFLILDRITDVRNFGAIARTAECAGVNAIIIPSKGAAQINEDALKTSAGALSKINVCRIDQMKPTIEFLQQSGIQIIACTEKAAKDIYEINYAIPTAIIMGSEEDGISPELLKIADELVNIPLYGEIESLNVSVASGIILYEVIRQRLKI
jgi:23S rRNA (guanosine2251-2'-O)-methyltransferase